MLFLLTGDHDMNKLHRLILVGLLLALSGCIVTASPDPNTTIHLERYGSQAFLITATKAPFPSNTSIVYKWYVNDDYTGTANAFFTFTAWPEYFDSTIEIKGSDEIWQHTASGDVLISTDSRSWTVEVE